jgi:type VI secretion system protein ImpF
VSSGPAAHETVRESVLDRLLDNQPEFKEHDPAGHSHGAITRLFEAILRDLEWLLSTRLVWVDDSLLACEHASRSVAAYGLADLSHEAPGSPDTRLRLKRAIEDAIARFEPRLTRVNVTPEPPVPHQRGLRFRIDAVLRVDPVREPVTFDTFLEPDGVARVTEA